MLCYVNTLAISTYAIQLVWVCKGLKIQDKFKPPLRSNYYGFDDVDIVGVLARVRFCWRAPKRAVLQFWEFVRTECTVGFVSQNHAVLTIDSSSLEFGRLPNRIPKLPEFNLFYYFFYLLFLLGCHVSCSRSHIDPSLAQFRFQNSLFQHRALLHSFFLPFGEFFNSFAFLSSPSLYTPLELVLIPNLCSTRREDRFEPNIVGVSRIFQ